MDTRVEKTLEKRKQGYNCAQSVACTYCDLVGVDEKVMFQMTEALGAGMGNKEGTCGAVSAACVLAGLKNSTGNLQSPDSNKDTAKLSAEILDKFIEKNQSVICKALKGVETGKALRSCPGCIQDAAALAEEVLFQE